MSKFKNVCCKLWWNWNLMSHDAFEYMYIIHKDIVGEDIQANRCPFCGGEVVIPRRGEQQ